MPRTKEEFVDMNYRKVRESCERIASVLGINANPTILNSMKSPNNNKPDGNDYFSPNKRTGDDTTMASHFFNPR